MASPTLRSVSLAARGAAGRRGGLARLGALAAGTWLAACAVCALLPPAQVSGSEAFVSGVAPRAARGGVPAHAEPAAASPSPSVALVKVTEENKMTTASVLGGVAGLLVGGVWVGGALFAATAYLTRKEDSDISRALKGVASGGLEVLNFGAYLNDKYAVTGKIGSALSDAVSKAKASSDSKETINSVESFLKGVTDAIEAADKDIGIKDTLGTLATSASELASQAVDKAVDLNAQYKITDKIKEKIEEVTEKAKST